MNLNAIILGAIGTMVSIIMSIITVFVVLFFIPLLNKSTSLSADAHELISTVYPILLVLLPLFTIIAGFIITVMAVKHAGK